MLAQYGASRESMLGLTPNQLFAHNRMHGRELWRKLLDAGKIRLESDERKADGTPMWIEGEYIVLYDAQERITGHFGIQRDITARKQSEKSLRLFRSLIDLVNDSIEVIDPETGRFLDVNEYACRSHGYTREEYLALSVPEIDPLVGREPWAATLKSIRDTDALVIETAHRRKDGSVFPVEVNCSSVFVDREYILAVVRDISERKCAEQALRESEQRYKAIFQNAPDALFVMSADGDDVGRIVAANEQAARMHDLPLSEMINRNIAEFDTPEAAEHAPDRLRRIAAGERLTFEIEHVRRDGSRIPVEVTAGRIELDGKSHVLAFDRDITDRRRAERAEEERRRLEAQILHAQKLESLGVLAGGIAHDFNNLMTVVLGYASLALMKIADDSPAAPMLREIEKGAQRATELTQQMLAYAGKGNFLIQPLRLDTLVYEMNSLLHTAVSKRAIVQLNLQPCTIEGDATQIRQVVMNLITNASDSLGDSAGIIRISTGVLNADAAYLQSRYTPESLPAGSYAFVQIADTGCGMSEETLSRIFDPFFTTKFTGRGLGLAGVLGIVRSHRGTIKVESSPGAGALFEVLLPGIATASRSGDGVGERAAPRGQGTVLVVDDERTQLRASGAGKRRLSRVARGRRRGRPGDVQSVRRRNCRSGAGLGDAENGRPSAARAVAPRRPTGAGVDDERFRSARIRRAIRHSRCQRLHSKAVPSARTDRARHTADDSARLVTVVSRCCMRGAGRLE
jgi:PAS domain S-box-containing protein